MEKSHNLMNGAEKNGGCMDFKDIRYHKEGPLAWITLDRPETLNAFSTDMLSGFEVAVKDAKEDDSIKVVLLAAEGRAFCAGGNVKEMARGELAGWDMKNYLWNRVHHMLLVLEDLDKPLIAVINGAASGGGFDLTLACDMRVASERATFCASYVRIGLAPGGGGAYRLPRLIGMAKGLEIMLTGRIFDAKTAFDLGVVNRVTPHDSLNEEARALASEIARWPLDAVRMVKRAAYNAAQSSLRGHLDYISSQLALLSLTPEHREAVAKLAKHK